jgi:HD-like signal output (HDOD) protein/ActR/RegA family two-component response regulator
MRRILFVDDDPHVLDGLRDLLRRERDEWDMVFALGGVAALGELEGQPFDVVVSDMRMPEVDGATLLRIVQERHPETVRIVLSGQTDIEAALRVVPVAHQFLAKPCERDELRGAIARACLSRALLTDAGVRRATGGAESLPSAPTLYSRLVEVSADPETTMDDIGALVESDIAMCAKVLQLVNSAFFGLGRRISSAREAVTYLGLAPLRALVLSAGAFRAFTPAHPIEGFSVEALEAHSSLVARTASAMLPSRHKAAEAFTAGMLHDVGKLILAMQRPDELATVIAAAHDEGRPLHILEHERLGVTHAEVGAYLLSLWRLPAPIVEAVAHHHTPYVREAAGLDPGAAVYIADRLVAEHETAAHLHAGTREPVDEGYLAELGVLDRLDAWRQLAAERVGAADAAE